MTDKPEAESESSDHPEDAVATGTADKTPFVAIGATALIIAALFVFALGVAALAYWLAS
jgi:hypothetical protein